MKYTAIECEERNAPRLINTFLDKDIRVKNVKIADGKLSFCIDDKNLDRVKKTLESQKIQYTILKRGGSYMAKKLVLRYLSLAVCAVIAVTGICLGRGVCLGVEIACDNKSAKAQIEQILEDSGYGKYSRKSAVDTKALSYAIASGVEGIGFADCYFDGAILKIVVQEVHEGEEQEKYSKIVAACDGIITRVLVYSGTALVEAGDVVKAGDVLIEGYIDTYPDTEENERIYVQADGEVYAECAYSARLTVSDKAVERVRTGNSYKNTELYVFGKRIGKAHTPKYAAYESVSESKTFGSVFPVFAVTTTYYEVEEREITLTSEQIDEQIIAAQMQLWQELPPQAKLLNNYTLRKKVDNLHIIDIYYIVEQAICQGV